MRTILAAICAAGALAAADFSVGTATAPPGAKATGYLEIPAAADAAARIPVIVVHGAKSGPVLALVAGAHGTEYASIVALEKLAQSANAASLSGTLIIVPLLNLASFQEKVPHLNPVDRKNMNRYYPGNSGGTQTERISWEVARQIVQKCDYLLDYHGGDLDENLRKYAYWPDTGDAKLGQAARGMVLAFGLDHVIIQNARGPIAPGAPVTLTRYALTLNKPAIAVEAGHSGTVNAEDVDALVDGTLSVMRHLRMLPGEPKTVEHPVWIGHLTTVASDREGIFYPLAVPEAYVAQGATIGYLTDYFGNRVHDIAAPVSGIVAYIAALPSMPKGGTIANIGEIAQDPQH